MARPSRADDNGSSGDAGATIWVGGLPADIQESEIFEEYERFGKIRKIDIVPQEKQPYAFVHFFDRSCAKKAVEATNQAALFGQSFVKVNWAKIQGSATSSDSTKYRRNPDFETQRPIQADAKDKGEHRIFVENLPEDMGWQELRQLGEKFAKVGQCTFARTHPDRTGELEFTSFRDMELAIQELDQRRFSGSNLKLRASAMSGQEEGRKRRRSPQGRDASTPYRDNGNKRFKDDSSGNQDDRARIWIGGLPDDLKDDDLERVYKKFGKILFVDVRRPREGNVYAFVTFASQSSAERAIEATDQMPLFGMKFVKVRWPSRERPEDNADRKHTETPYVDSASKQDENARIWIGGLPKQTEEYEIESVYKRFGRIAEISINRSRGDLAFAFVTFSRYSAAERAIQETNQKSLFGQRFVKVSWPSHDKPEESHNHKKYIESSHADRGGKQEESKSSYVYSDGKQEESERIWIGGLPKQIEEYEIESAYKKFGKIVEVDIRRPNNTWPFAFVTFSRYGAAERAIQETNQEPLFGQKFVKVSWPSREKQEEEDIKQSASSHNDSGVWQDENARIWIGGIPKTTEEEEIESVYKKFGRIVELELVQSHGEHNFAFVTFSRNSAAERAIQETNQESFFGQRYIKVSWPSKDKPEDSHNHKKYTESSYADRGGKQEADRGGKQEESVRIWVGGLPKQIEEDEIESVYKRFGRIVNVDIRRPHNALAFAFVKFARLNAAERAIQETNQEPLFGQNFVKVAWPSRERPDESFEDAGWNESGDDYSAKKARIWIGGLSERIQEEDIEQVYRKYGKILSVDIRRPKGAHAFAFVQYSKYSSAEWAIKDTNQQPLFGMKFVKVSWPSRE